jgi:PIN domain nuclease of toxin-antitoxin system
VYVSVVSFWEIAIKISLGKLKLPFALDVLVDETIQNQIVLLDIELKHVLAVSSLPFHHRDPFDRLIACQAITEGLYLVSSDSIFEKYGVDLLW